MRDDKQPEHLEGTVEDVIFYNEDSGFTVLAVSVEDELITLVGKTSGVAEGEEITAEGHYDVHPRFGHQFKADVILRTLPTTSNAILKYLSSGAIKGIGPAIARRLVDRFRDSTLEVMEKQPERLAEVRGISADKARAIGEEFARLFAALERHPAPFAPEPVVETAGAVKEKTVEMEIAQSKMAMGFRTGSIPDKATMDAVKLMAFLYGGTPFSRLFVHVREEKSLCYYCAARFDQVTGILMVDIGVERDDQPAARAAILEQLAAVAAGDFSDEELASARLSYINSLRSVPDGLSAQESWYLGQILRGTQFTPEEEVEAIARVDREAVIAAANQVTLDTVYFLAAKPGENEEKEEGQHE